MPQKTNGVYIVSDKKEYKQFLEFPYTLYKNHPFWVPPLRLLQSDILNQSKNPFYQNAEMAMFLAESDGKLAGRIAAIHNRTYNEYTGTNSGFFGFFECLDNQKAADLLFKVAEDWLRDRGVEQIYGPMSPNMMGEIGVLIEGFELKPMFLMPYNYPYYDQLITNTGYTKHVDLLAYYLTKDASELDRAKKAEELVLRRYPSLSVRKVNLRDWKNELITIREIFNSAWSKNWGFTPISKEEFEFLVSDLRYILDPDLTLVVEDNNKPVAFSIGLPDVNMILGNMNGKLLPTGWYKLLTGIKKCDVLRLALMGILPDYQGKGIDALMNLHSIRNGLAKGYWAAEFSWLLETNAPVINLAERFGSVLTKRYRMYIKQ
jgi:GNAT superfamily N-acetyltransferase